MHNEEPWKKIFHIWSRMVSILCTPWLNAVKFHVHIDLVLDYQSQMTFPETLKMSFKAQML